MPQSGLGTEDYTGTINWGRSTSGLVAQPNTGGASVAVAAKPAAQPAAPASTRPAYLPPPALIGQPSTAPAVQKFMMSAPVIDREAALSHQTPAQAAKEMSNAEAFQKRLASEW